MDSLLDREQALRYPGRDRRINRPGHSRVVAIENNSLRSHRKNQPDRWLTRGRALQSDKYPDQSHNHDPQGADQENNQDCGVELLEQTLSSTSALFVAPRTPIFPGFSRMVARLFANPRGPVGFQEPALSTCKNGRFSEVFCNLAPSSVVLGHGFSQKARVFGGFPC